jgi:hypothetical protein
VVNPSEVRIVSKSKSYQSWKALADSPSYGPMYNSSTSSNNENPLITFVYGRNNLNHYQFEISGNYSEYTNTLKIYNLSDAQIYLRKLENGEIQIVDALHNYERSTYEEQEVKAKLRGNIEKIERGEIKSVEYDWCGCDRNCYTRA